MKLYPLVVLFMSPFPERSHKQVLETDPKSVLLLLQRLILLTNWMNSLIPSTQSYSHCSCRSEKACLRSTVTSTMSWSVSLPSVSMNELSPKRRVANICPGINATGGIFDHFIRPVSTIDMYTSLDKAGEASSVENVLLVDSAK